jgi:hypothetical protein
MAPAEPELVNRRWKEMRPCVLGGQFFLFGVNGPLSPAMPVQGICNGHSVWLFDHKFVARTEHRRNPGVVVPHCTGFVIGRRFAPPWPTE